VASQHFINGAATPPLQGGEYAVPYIRHRNYEPLYIGNSWYLTSMEETQFLP